MKIKLNIKQWNQLTNHINNGDVDKENLRLFKRKQPVDTSLGFGIDWNLYDYYLEVNKGGLNRLKFQLKKLGYK